MKHPKTRTGGRRRVMLPTARPVGLLILGGAGALGYATSVQQTPPAVSAPASGGGVPALPARAAGTPAVHTPSVGPRMPRPVPVRLRVPAIGVNHSVLKLGLNRDQTVEVPPLSEVPTPGWYEYSPTRGGVGTAVILGHIDSAKEGAGVCFRLGGMTEGDEIAVNRADGSTAHFAVYAVHEYPKSHFPAQAVYGNTARAELRLIGCGGSLDRAKHSYRDDIVVYARLVSGSGSQAG